MKTQMSRTFQPYASFSIENDSINFYSNKIFPIDPMLTGDNQEPTMLSEM